MGGFVLFVVIAVVVLAIVGLSAYWNYKRGQALAAFAAAQGWSYVYEADAFADRWDGEPFGRGDRRETNNAIRGPYQGIDMVAFEYLPDTHADQERSQHADPPLLRRRPADPHFPPGTLGVAGRRHLTDVRQALQH